MGDEVLGLLLEEAEAIEVPSWHHWPDHGAEYPSEDDAPDAGAATEYGAGEAGAQLIDDAGPGTDAKGPQGRDGGAKAKSGKAGKLSRRRVRKKTFKSGCDGLGSLMRDKSRTPPKRRARSSG